MMLAPFVAYLAARDVAYRVAAIAGMIYVAWRAVGRTRR